MNDELLLSVCRTCVNLKTLHVDDCEQLTVAFFQLALSRNVLRSIEVIDLWNVSIELEKYGRIKLLMAKLKGKICPM